MTSGQRAYKAWAKYRAEHGSKPQAKDWVELDPDNQKAWEAAAEAVEEPLNREIDRVRASLSGFATQEYD